jgi:hypothetical protein
MIMRASWILFMAGCGFQAQAVAVDGPGGPDDRDSGDRDGAIPDAGLELATCPANYDAPLPGPSHYRLIVDGHRAWEQSDACEHDMPGAAHLAVIKTTEELTAIAAFIKDSSVGIANNAVWIGGVQQQSARQTDEGWLGFDGTALFNGWDTKEPNDKDGDEAGHQEQFVMIAKGKSRFTDTSGNDADAALCECDGEPLAKAAADEIAGYRPKP